MASNDQLNKYMKQNENKILHGLKYLGAVPSNLLPKITNDLRNSCIIVNYSPSWTSGSHWCGIRIDGTSKTVSWFDSYGNPPDKDDSVIKTSTHFREFCKKVALTFEYKYEYNRYDFQSLYTDVCGLYSIYFCLNGLPSVNPEAWADFKDFAHDQIRNDQVVVVNGTEEGKMNNDRIIKKLVHINIPFYAS